MRRSAPLYLIRASLSVLRVIMEPSGRGTEATWPMEVVYRPRSSRPVMRMKQPPTMARTMAADAASGRARHRRPATPTRSFLKLIEVSSLPTLILRLPSLKNGARRQAPGGGTVPGRRPAATACNRRASSQAASRRRTATRWAVLSPIHLSSCAWSAGLHAPLSRLARSLAACSSICLCLSTIRLSIVTNLSPTLGRRFPATSRESIRQQSHALHDVLLDDFLRDPESRGHFLLRQIIYSSHPDSFSALAWQQIDRLGKPAKLLVSRHLPLRRHVLD